MFDHFARRPLVLISSRVWRTYTGGMLIDRLQRKDNPCDNNFPEEWIASLISARNPSRESVVEGLSFIEISGKRGPSLKECIDDNPSLWLGRKHFEKFGENTGILCKMLDSAERLTIQVHPSKEKAKELFNSEFGKTEAWYVINCRVIDYIKPRIYLGFKPKISKEKWTELFKRQDINGMINCLNSFEVHSGQAFLVKGGVPHAIGSGCFIIEIQEPTDYTIRVENKTPKGLKIEDKQMHQGLGFSRMIDCFDFTDIDYQNPNDWKICPSCLVSTDDGMIKRIIDYAHTPLFAMDSYTVLKKMQLKQNNCFSVLVFLSGSGIIKWDDNEIKIRQGQQVFLPAGLDKAECIRRGNEKLEFIRCYPPNT